MSKSQTIRSSISLILFSILILSLNLILMSQYSLSYAQQEEIVPINPKDIYLDHGDFSLYVLSSRDKVFRIDTRNLEIVGEYDFSFSTSIPQYRMIHCNNKLFIILFNSEQIEIGIFNNITNTVLLLAFSTVYIPSHVNTIFAYNDQIGMILANGSLIFFSPETEEFTNGGVFFTNVIRLSFSAEDSTLMTYSDNPTNLSFYNLKNHQLTVNYTDSTTIYGLLNFQPNSNLFTVSVRGESPLSALFLFDSFGNLVENVTYNYIETGLGSIRGAIVEHDEAYYFCTSNYFCKLLNRSIIKLFSSEVFSYHIMRMLSDNSTNQIYITSSSKLYVYSPSLNETIEIQYTYTINTHSEPIGLYWIPIILGCMILIGGTALLIKTLRR